MIRILSQDSQTPGWDWTSVLLNTKQKCLPIYCNILYQKVKTQTIWSAFDSRKSDPGAYSEQAHQTPNAILDREKEPTSSTTINTDCSHLTHWSTAVHSHLKSHQYTFRTPNVKQHSGYTVTIPLYVQATEIMSFSWHCPWILLSPWMWCQLAW